MTMSSDRRVIKTIRTERFDPTLYVIEILPLIQHIFWPALRLPFGVFQWTNPICQLVSATRSVATTGVDRATSICRWPCASTDGLVSSDSGTPSIAVTWQRGALASN